MYADRQTDRQAYIHAHVSSSAVPLVWGSLRLAPIMFIWSYRLTLRHFLVAHSYSIVEDPPMY